VELPADVTFEVTTPLDIRGDEEFWRLYEASFGPAEREPREVIVNSMEIGSGLAIRARVADRTIGLATAQVLDDVAVTFLVYLAIDPDWRSKRFGSALFDAVDAAGAAGLADRMRSPAGIVWEVEDPNNDIDEAERRLRQGRLRFYEKLGGRMLDTPYIQPPVDGHTLVPMRLMFRPAQGRSQPDRAASAALVRAIYFQKYHAMNRIPIAILEDLAAGLGAGEPDRQ